jgi:alkylhydroperoxidase family enzyme
MPNDATRGAAAFEPAALAERQADTVGKPPRIPPMTPEEMSPEALGVVKDMRKAVGLNPDDLTEVPDYMSIVLRHAGLYEKFGYWGLELLAHGALPVRDRELAVLRTGWLHRAPFEWGEHVGFVKRAGCLTPDEVERIKRGSSDPAWNDADRAVLRAAEELHADSMLSEATWAALAKRFDQKQLIELPFVIGHYTMVAYYQNALRIPMAAGNDGLNAR